MKLRRETNQRQAKLFLELGLFNEPTFPDLPPDKEVELKRVLADLLLRAACGNAEVPKGVTMTHKLTPAHLQRRAIIYVRQSRPTQLAPVTPTDESVATPANHHQ